MADSEITQALSSTTSPAAPVESAPANSSSTSGTPAAGAVMDTAVDIEAGAAASNGISTTLEDNDNLDERGEEDGLEGAREDQEQEQGQEQDQEREATSMDRSAASSRTSSNDSENPSSGGIMQAHSTSTSSHRLSSGLAPQQQTLTNGLEGDMDVDDSASASASASAPATPLLGGTNGGEEADAAGDATIESGAVTPTMAQHSHDLSDQEMATFGVSSVEDPLPPPPKDQGGKSKGSAGWGAAGLGLDGVIKPGSKRAPKSVKISAGVATSAKGPKVLARRAAVTANKGLSGEEAQLPNNDYCDSCLGKGHFLCCDGGCLRSFHFTCLDPPLDVDDVPDEAWYCKACRAQKNPPPPPPRGFFRELIYKLEYENPKVFQLTPEIKSLYKNVATGSVGEYIDTLEHRPPSKITGRAVGQEDRDGYKLRDKSGKTLICYNCNETASIAKQRRIISCDFCEQHWHLDCLDPPMTGMPPPTRKWMCPIHTEHVLPKKRVPRNTTTIPVQARDVSNNGDILVIPRREPRTLDDDRYEEITVNRVRYQVPEETIILDFWGKSGAANSGLRGPAPRKSIDGAHFEGGASASRNGSPDTVMSLATSGANDSDADPPEVDRLGYSPYSRRYNPLYASTSKVASSIASPTRSAQTGASSSSSFVQETSALDGLALLAEVRYSDLLASKTGAQDDVTMNEGDAGRARSGSYSPTLDKGKGRAIDAIAGARCGSPAAPGSNGHGNPASKSSALDLPAIPPNQAKLGPSIFAFTVGKLSDGMLNDEPSPDKPSDSTTGAPETTLPLQSKEDLQALMHVRKLLQGSSNDERAKAVLDFLGGDAVVPQLEYMSSKDRSSSSTASTNAASAMSTAPVE